MIILILQGAGASNDVLNLVAQSSLLAKFVLLVLLVFSLSTWAIILSKASHFSKIRKRSAKFREIFENAKDILEVAPQVAALRPCPLVQIYSSGIEEAMNQTSGASGANPHSVNPDRVTRAIQRAVLGEVSSLESGIPWLATAANASPFIGLFGTVVGIIVAFQGLSSSTATSVQAVAPGIADALIATAAGLGVAVPSAIFYNYFVNRLKRITSEMDDFSLDLINEIEDRWRRPYGNH